MYGYVRPRCSFTWWKYATDIHPKHSLSASFWVASGHDICQHLRVVKIGQNWFKSGLLWSTVIYCASGWSVLSSTITDLSCGVSLCQPMFEILGSFALQWIYDWTAWLLDSIWFKLIQWCLILQWPQFGPLDSVSNSLQQRHSWITVRNGGHRYGRHC